METNAVANMKDKHIMDSPMASVDLPLKEAHSR